MFQAAKRLATLDAAHEGLVFGRLDTVDGEARYIGRLGLRDAEREVLLIDWRAPAASVFYQATAQDPLGVVRRRVLQSLGRPVIGVQDELLDAANAPDDMVIVGEGALHRRALALRDARCTDRGDDPEGAGRRDPRAAEGRHTIAGGPGTGKTVVALHRAAYLLYTDRRRFESGGVLVVGPNAVFMAYIERVLPSLGETSVSSARSARSSTALTAVRHDPPAVAAIKGSARMRTRAVPDGRGRPSPTRRPTFRDLLPRRRADTGSSPHLRGRTS